MQSDEPKNETENQETPPPEDQPTEQSEHQPQSRGQSTPAEPEESWTFRDDSQESQPALSSAETQQPGEFADGPELSWTAFEFIAHEKDTMWYVSFGGIAAVLITLTFLITGQDKVVTGVTAFAILSFGMFASRKPRTLPYRLDHTGLTIGEKHFTYGGFKSFSVQKEDAIDSIFLMPMKRYLPGLTIYYPQEQEKQVVETLSSYLPHEMRAPDAVDRLMRKVRF